MRRTSEGGVATALLPPVLRREPVLAGLGLALAVVMAWFVLVPSGDAARSFVFWVVQPVLDVVMVVLCRRIGHVAGVDPGVRRFWRWLGRAGVLFTIGDVAATWTALVRPGRDAAVGGLAQSLPIALGIGVMVVVVLTHPIEASRSERWRIWLDAATVMAGAGAFVWFGNARTGPASPAVALVSTVTLVSVFGLARLTLATSPPFTRPAAAVGILGVGSFGLVTAVLPAPSPDAPLGPWLVVRLLPSFLIAVTPRVQELGLRADPARRVARRRRPYSLLPYLAVGATQVLLITVVVQSRLPVEASGVIFGGVAATGLVVVRQFAALHDNAVLLTRLDASLAELAGQERRFRSLVQHAADITVVVDRGGRVTYVSPAVESVLGTPPEQALGRRVLSFLDPAEARRAAGLWRDLTAAPGDSREWVLRARRDDGEPRWLGVIATNLFDDPGVDGVVCNARDVTESHHLQQRLRHEAAHDPLTQLFNRAGFEERLEATYRQAARWGSVAVLMVDLDDFKPVNDLHGHHVGDALLREVAGRLRNQVRDEDVAARLGGDEFVLLLPGLGREHAVEAASRVLAELRRPVDVGDVRLTVAASIGVAAGAPTEVHTLLRDADAALYVAKRAGKNLCRLAGDPDPQGEVHRS